MMDLVIENQKKFIRLGSLLNYLRWLFSYKTRVETDSGAVQDVDFTRSVYKILADYSLKDNMKLLITAEGGLKTRISGVEKYVTKAYDLSDSDIDPAQTTEADQPFLGGRIASNEIQNFKSVTGVTKTLAHTDIAVSGTYTLINVLNAEDSGKTVVSFTEVSSGTYNSIEWTGKLYAYGIYGGTISEANQALIEAELLSLVAEVESVTIGTQEWATSNCEMGATPMGNVIQEMQDASAVEKITGGDFESGMVGNFEPGDGTCSWTLNTSSPISGSQDGLLEVTAVGTHRNRPFINPSITSVSGKWYKISFDYKVNSGTVIISGIHPGSGLYSLGKTLSGTGNFTIYLKSSGTSNLGVLYFDGRNLFSLQIDNWSIQQLGWADSRDLYDGLIAQGYSEADAVKECAAWCYYNNDPEIGAVFGKLYNWFAAKLLQNDIDAYNAANPTTPWGWHVPTQTEFETLTTALGGTEVAGGKMKVAGTDYWNTPNTGADNSSGFSVLGGGIRWSDGGFRFFNEYNFYYTITNPGNPYRSILTYSSAVLSLSNNLIETNGFSLRLIKD